MNIVKDVARSDKARIIGKISRNDDGYLQGTAIVARSGILEYFEGGRMVKEYVPPEELARADSLATLRLKPVTNGHPSARLVTPSNVKQFQVGMTGENVHSDGDVLSSTITINDNAAISEVNAGKRELSCGYRCDIVNEPGTTTSGERYDRMQTNRRYNHVAICDLGRAGPVASLNMDEAARTALLASIHLDAADVFETGTPNFREDHLEEGSSDETISKNIKHLVESGYSQEQAGAIAYKKAGKSKKDSISPSKRSRPMNVPITLKSIVYNDQAPEVAAALTDALATIETVRKDSTTALAAMQTKLDAETAAHTATKTKLDAANAEIAAMPAKVLASAKARAELVAVSKPHLDQADQDKIDSLSDAQIKLAVANKAFPAAKETLATVKVDNADAVNTWYTAALTTLKNDATDAAAAANRESVNGKPDPTKQTHTDSQEEWEKNQLKHDHKGNREQFLRN